MSLTLDDILKKSPEEILEQIVTRKHVTPEIPEETIIIKLKKKLKNCFQVSTKELKTGRTIRVDGTFLKITTILKSSNRVFFTVKDTGTKFSVTRDYLTGETPEEFPYKKGDHISFQGNEYEVIGINPASRNILVSRENDKRKVCIDRVTKVGE